MNSSPVSFGPAGRTDDQARAVLESTLLCWWSELLADQSVGVHSDFFQLGGRPEHATRLVDRITAEWDVAIRSSELYEARTISKLAELIQIRQTSREQLCIVPIRAEGDRKPLFLVHGVGGNILGFAGLARSLHHEQPVYGIQAQALNSEVPTLIRLEAMAAFYVQELRRVQPVGPYAFLGFSFGGLVAYEMAQQLTAAGEQVRFLGMLDSWQPGHLRQVEIASHSSLKRGWKRLHMVRLNTKKLSLFQLIGYLGGRLKGRFLRVAFGHLARGGAVSLPESMRQVRDINLTAAARYVVRPYPGNITLFRAEDHTDLTLPEDLNWRAYAGDGVEIIRLPGDHGQILAEPNLSFMTRWIDELLAPSKTPSREVEEFELDDDRLVNLKVETVSVSHAHTLQLLPAWIRETASIPMTPSAGLSATPRKVTE